MPTLVLLAGPNGAGKTTFINGFLRERAEAFQFVNPDEVVPLVIPDARQRDPGRTAPPHTARKSRRGCPGEGVSPWHAVPGSALAGCPGGQGLCPSRPGSAPL